MNRWFVAGALGVLFLSTFPPALASAFSGCIYQGRSGPISYYFCPPPGWRGEVPKLPGVSVVSVRSPKALSLPPSAGLPRALDEIILDAARRHSVDPKLIRAVISVESGWNPRAVSRKGAQGLMQLMPETAERYGVRVPFDPRENVEGGVQYLRDLLNEFRDLRLALAAYNAGEEAVRRYGGIPPYPETQAYVRGVLAEYRKLRG